MAPIARLDVFALDCRDPRALAEFYAAITGWTVVQDEDDWVEVRGAGPVGLAFQLAPDHVPPDWPSSERPQQAHLDFDVDDLDAAEAGVVALGAVKAAVQPDPGFRVFLDPAGHPFCLVLASG
jgi:catechol 2,3-dioxygenase-like lactoylglutathione lyase family enzyme